MRSERTRIKLIYKEGIENRESSSFTLKKGMKEDPEAPIGEKP